MTVRIVHSADWQIGLKARHVAAAAERVRAARFEAAARVVALAADRRAHALLVAGDVFDHPMVEDRVVRQLASVLALCPCPVYLLPGNHDPLGPGSVWGRPAWTGARPPHVHVLDGFEPVRVPGAELVLLPCPLSRRRSVDDPTFRMAAAPAGKSVVVGIAHGGLAIAGKHQEDAHPIGLDVVERTGVDYLALGDWHSTYLHGERIAYSGAHETTKFGEDRSGAALVVTITERGARPAIEAAATGVLSWQDHALDMGLGTGALEELRGRTLGLPSASDTLLRVTTSGSTTPDLELAFSRLLAELEPRLLALVVVREDRPEGALAGRLAEVAAGSPLVSGLVARIAGLEDPVLKREASRKLAELVAEVFP